MLNHLAIGIIAVSLLISLYSDIRYRKIYNIVTLPVFVTGFFVSGFIYWSGAGWKGVLLWLSAIVLGALTGWVLEKGVVWAAGDTKLYLGCLTWLCVLFHPLTVTISLIAVVLILHFLLNVLVRLMKHYTIGIPWLFRLIPRSQYPGAITIALAVLLVVVSFET